MFSLGDRVEYPTAAPPLPAALRETLCRGLRAELHRDQDCLAWLTANDPNTVYLRRARLLIRIDRTKASLAELEAL